MAESKRLQLAILWHMHQPFYRDPASGILNAPWVRLHATKDYLDMLLAAANYDNLKMTFNLVPSLIEQLRHYESGGTDNHLELTRRDPAVCDMRLKQEILSQMFKCQVERMIKPNPRYFQLYQKWQNGSTNHFENNFTDQEIRDAQLWSNLVWVDPLFRGESPVKQLFEKSREFTEQDKLNLIEWQLNHIRKIIPAYQNALNKGKIEISFSPYFHPILPLLCDTNSAKEALSDINLPAAAFRHPEDAREQIVSSINLFQELFGSKLSGMWPSEGSVSDETLRLCRSCGINWLAGDEEILFRSLQKSNLDPSAHHPYKVYQHAAGIKMLFRDHQLSDKIGFVYSNWEPNRAAEDFIAHVKNVRSRLAHFEGDIIVPVILDGENAWEFYPDDGREFLETLYKKISSDSEIETVTFSQAIEQHPATKFDSIFAGSWINHNFKIWIGHEEDNAAWNLLKNARDFLVVYQNKYPQAGSEIIKSAWRQIYIAEGSDWFWWYGDEHRGPDNHRFDLMFRTNLIRVYELLKAEPPEALRLPIITQKYLPAVQLPDALLTPKIDGRLSHFYEWFGAGVFQCIASDTTMHRVFRLVSTINFGFDHDNFYLKFELANPEELKSLKNLRIVISLATPREHQISLDINKIPYKNRQENVYECAIDNVFELAITRKFLWTEAFGVLAFRVEVYDKDQLLEKWPESGVITCELPEKHKELFWHQ